MLTSKARSMLACVQFKSDLQLVHVSVKIDHRLRVGTVHISEGPEMAKTPGSHRFQWSMLKRN